jgi:branched-chain amino acid transport system substrate-binding protein
MRCYRTLVVAIVMGCFIFIGINVKADSLKIGVITVLSGSGAEWGTGLLHGVEMATEEINERGGVKIGGKTYRTELIICDDKYTAKGGAACAEKLVHRDKVKFIIGPISSASLLAFQVVTEDAKVLVLGDSFSDEALSPKKPFTLRIRMTSVEGAPILTDWLLQQYPHAKKVVTIAPNDASGHAGIRGQELAYRKHGIELTSKEFYERGTKDFSPLVTRVQFLNPDLIFFVNAPGADNALMIKLFREMGSKALFVDNTGLEFASLIRIAGKEASEGYMWGAYYDPSDPKVIKFAERHRKKYNLDITCVEYLAFYQATKAFYYAIEKAQSLDPATVRDTMKYRIPEFEDVMGKLEFGGKEIYGIDNQALGCYYASVIRDGKMVILKRLR